MAEPGKSGANKVVAGAGRFQQRAEQHEHKHHTVGNPKCDAENTFGRQPIVGHPFDKTGALMCDDIRHMGAAKGVNDKHTGDNHQRRPECPACRFQQQNQTDHRDNQIQSGRIAHTIRQLNIEYK